MNDSLKFPRTVDEPPMMLIWRGDELIPFFTVFITGFMLKQIFISLVLGIFAIKIARKYRDLHPNGYLVHLLWWKGIMPINTRVTRNPFVRKYYNYHMTRINEK